MKQVAKLLMIDNEQNYLLLERSAHPTLPNDADLPGGVVEPDEDTRTATIREVVEEAGVVVDPETVEFLYRGTDFSSHDTEYFLYQAQFTERPNITISWEHAGFEWLERKEFLQRAAQAKDSYMHMVHDVLNDTLASA